MVAGGRGDIATTQILLDRGADVNAKDLLGETALWRTILEDGHMDIMNALLDKGADINAKNYAGETVLMRAVEWYRSEFVEVFLYKGADVNAIDNEGKTALSRAKNTRFTYMIQFLKKAEAKE